MRSVKIASVALAGVFLVTACGSDGNTPVTGKPQAVSTAKVATANDALAPNACDLLSTAEINQALGVATKADQAAKSDLPAVAHDGSEFGNFYSRQCTITPNDRKVGEADIVVTASQYPSADNAIGSYTKSVSGMNDRRLSVLDDGVQATTDYVPELGQAQVLIQKNSRTVSVIVNNGSFADAQAAATVMTILGGFALTFGDGTAL